MHYIGVRPQAIVPDPSSYSLSTTPLPQSKIDDREVREERVVIRHYQRSRSRSRERRSRSRERRPSSPYSSDSDDELDIRVRRHHEAVIEDNSSSTVYSFSPSRASRSIPAQVGGLVEDDPSEKAEEEAGPPKEERRPKASHVFESRYTGESCLGGLHTAELTATISAKVKYQPLFRWM